VIGNIIPHSRIVEKLGGGGMGALLYHLIRNFRNTS
jgi:hypothetical protein